MSFCKLFFFPGAADKAQRLGPEIGLNNIKVKFEHILGSSCTSKTKVAIDNKNKTHTGRPANPPARFAFRLARKQQSNSRPGPEPKTKQTTQMPPGQRGK
jgi:hypothetical protein